MPVSPRKRRTRELEIGKYRSLSWKERLEVLARPKRVEVVKAREGAVGRAGEGKGKGKVALQRFRF